MIWAVVKEDSERADQWRAIVGSHRVPVRRAVPEQAQACHGGWVDIYVYRMNVGQLTDEQISRAIGYLQRTMGMDELAARNWLFLPTSGLYVVACGEVMIEQDETTNW